MPDRVRTERFPDLADPVLYPRMPAEKIAHLAERGERRRFAPGEVLYEQGQRDAPFIIIEEGLVDLLDRRPGEDLWFAQADAGTFVGDIAVFTGESIASECVAAEPTTGIVFDRQGLRALVAGYPEFAEVVLGAMMARRAWHEGEGHGVLRLVGTRGSRAAFEVRDLIERNLLPMRWYDAETDPESRALLDGLGIACSRSPVLIRNDTVLRDPSPERVAQELGLRASVDGERFDLVVLGAGPAGLAAAVYGGSEGLRTLVAEAWAPGGQAGTSARIENYLGFPNGISGTDLTRAATLQARRFDAVMSSFHPAVELREGPEDLLRVVLDDGQEVLARTLIMATGARWRELRAEGAERLTGAGLYHAAMPADAERCRGEDVIVVGGGNSAGQAAVHLAKRARSVRVVVRGEGLSATMSSYLLDRLGQHPSIEVLTGTQLVALHGARAVEGVTLRDRDGVEQRVRAAAVFAMIGAEPCSGAAEGLLALDAAGYVRCGPGLATGADGPWWPVGDRPPELLETARPGVYAAGDVRAGATNRVAGAVGDGALAVRFAHGVLAS